MVRPKFIVQTFVECIKKHELKLNMDTELLLNRISMITLLLTGFVFLYEGIKYIHMKNTNPSLPAKLYVAGILALFLGIVEIAFAIVHFFF